MLLKYWEMAVLVYFIKKNKRDLETFFYLPNKTVMIKWNNDENTEEVYNTKNPWGKNPGKGTQ